jgi:hypothetical protein
VGSFNELRNSFINSWIFRVIGMKINNVIGVWLLIIGLIMISAVVYHIGGVWFLLGVYGIIFLWIGYLEILND